MARAWHLASRPEGMPTAANFALTNLPNTSLADGEVRVRNRWLSVDPYMRGRMNDVKSYVPPFAVGAPLEGGAVGEVVESHADGLVPGDLVNSMLGWRDEAVGPAAAFTKLPALGVDPQQWLGNLGLTGATAYFGLLRVAAAKEGDVVFVSSAAGAVGSAVVQIAKARGMTVIGSAGGADKCAWVRELGADACVDYKAEPIVKGLMAAAPKGIDVYFDNVGGEHLDAAFAAARNKGRFVICGMIDGYNGGDPAQFRYMMRIIAARIRVEGFIFTDYLPEMPEFIRDMAGWIAGRQVTSRETVHDGLESAPDAFLGLFSGGNMGKMLVRL